MQQNLQKQFNLPSYTKGKSFGEAAKLIQGKFKDRQDAVSKRTMDEMLGNLQKAQEYVKMQQGLQNESQQVPDHMNGQVPEGMQEYAGGGFMDQSKAAFNADGAGPAAAITGGLGTAMEIGNELFGKTGVDMSGNQHVERESGGMNALTLGAKGAAAGAQIGGPLGAAIGGGLGVVGGFVGAGKANKEANIANNNFTHAQNAQFRESDFAFGGAVNKFDGGGAPITQDLQATAIAQPPIDKRLVQDIPPIVTASPPDEESKFSQATDWLGKNAGNIAQYAPVASNLSELIGLKRGVTERGSRLDNVYKEQKFDKAALVNQLNQRNTEQGLKESSGGNLGALRANMIGMGAGKDKALSEGLIKGDSINRNEGQFKFKSGLQKDSTNVGLDQQFLDNKAKDTAAYETTKSNLKRALAEDIGSIGREEVDKKLVRDMFGYKWNGKYYIDKDGKRKSTAEVKAEVAASKQQND